MTMTAAQAEKLKEAFKAKLSPTFAWDLLGESGSPQEGREELINVLVSVHNDAIESARDAVFATIDESRDNIDKLRIE